MKLKKTIFTFAIFSLFAALSFSQESNAENATRSEFIKSVMPKSENEAKAESEAKTEIETEAKADSKSKSVPAKESSKPETAAAPKSAPASKSAPSVAPGADGMKSKATGFLNEKAEEEPKTESGDEPKKIEIGETVFPDAKRPKKIDREKIDEAENNSEEGSLEKRKEILKFGMESEITELIDTLIKEEDPRFVNEIYDLFGETKSVVIRDKVLEYFTKLEDPCLEDFAVEILDDPFDQKRSTVSACFSYVQKVKTKEAINPILRLIEAEDENYFSQAMAALAEIGGEREAQYMVEFLDRSDLSVPQKQSLVKVLGNIKATETYERLVEMIEDEDENSFVRCYCAEAIGSMGREEAIPVLMNLFEDGDPNLREHALKGLSHFDKKEITETILQGTRDSHYKVRLQAINIIKEKELKEGVPYLIFRAKNDPEANIKNACYPVIAKLNVKEGNEYLVSQITDKKVPDTPKAKIAQALLSEDHTGKKEIIELAKEVLGDDRRKSLRYALGKEFAKTGDSDYSEICEMYLDSKDVATQGTGLDIYAKGRYLSAKSKVEELARQHKEYTEYEEKRSELKKEEFLKLKPVKKNANGEKAAKILKTGSDKSKSAE